MQIKGLARLDRKRSDDIRERLRQEEVLDIMLRKKKQWMETTEEKPEERLVKMMEMKTTKKMTEDGRWRTLSAGV